MLVMDNFSFHKGEKVRVAIESRVAKLTYSSSYSPELNTIEEMWSKIKAFYEKY